MSTLIKPSLSDDSRAPKISGCYLRGVGMPAPLQPAHSDFEYSDKMGLSAFEPRLSFKTLVGIPLGLSCY